MSASVYASNLSPYKIITKIFMRYIMHGVWYFTIYLNTSNQLFKKSLEQSSQEMHVFKYIDFWINRFKVMNKQTENTVTLSVMLFKLTI